MGGVGRGERKPLLRLPCSPCRRLTSLLPSFLPPHLPQVVVHNLPWDCTWQQLKDAFAECGEIDRADVVFDSRGRSRCALVLAPLGSQKLLLPLCAAATAATLPGAGQGTLGPGRESVSGRGLGSSACRPR